MNYYINKSGEKVEISSPSGTVKWSSPSNIALVKYWGKHGRQLPSNPSISFTLENARSTTSLEWSLKEQASQEVELDFYFENELKESFSNKIKKFFNSITDDFPFLTQFKLIIKSSNSFPHSAGIASSASSMSALALCLCEMELKLENNELEEESFFKKASYFARIGSGSASRSLFPILVTWGESEDNRVHSDNENASSFKKYDEVFESFHDSILIVDAGEKAVSSRAGHALMENHPFAQTRFSNASNNLVKLMDAMEKADLKTFGEIVEAEALELHGLMMNSHPSFILMKPNTLEIINEVRKFREETSHPLYFTLDAGPNVHLLYPQSIAKEVRELINTKLLQHTANGVCIDDKVGQGPRREE